MRSSGLLLVVVLVAAGCVAPPGGDPVRVEEEVTFPGLRIETRLGAFTAILYEAEHPATTAFMRRLVESGYYEGREFGRVIPTFVIQEVDRTGGTTDQPERVPLENSTNAAFSAGAFGIARDADPDSGGSEFFVMDFATSHLYGNFTAWAQVVEGMDVVHAIARVPAVKTGPAGGVVGSPPGSPVYFGVHDRVPVDPVKMTKLSLVNVTLPASEAAKYPLRVGPSVRTDTLRATLEWPANLDAGNASTLTWYVAGRDTSARGQVEDPPQPDLTGAVVVVEAEGTAPLTLQPSEDPTIRGKLRVDWTPAARGNYTLRLEKGGETLAATDVPVPTPPPGRAR